MAKSNTKQTSPRVASEAARVLRNPRAPKQDRSVAGSALAQAKPIANFFVAGVVLWLRMPFCETCSTLSASLHEAATRLTIASVHVHDLSGVGKPDLFAAAKLEAQSVRKECEAIKAELDHHRAEHHPPEQSSKTAGTS